MLYALNEGMTDFTYVIQQHLIIKQQSQDEKTLSLTSTSIMLGVVLTVPYIQTLVGHNQQVPNINFISL